MAKVNPDKSNRGRCLMPFLKKCGTDTLRSHLIMYANSKSRSLETFLLDNQWNILGCLEGHQRSLDQIYPPVKVQLKPKTWKLPLICSVIVACQAGPLDILFQVNDVRKLYHGHERTPRNQSCVCDLKWEAVTSTIHRIALNTGEKALIKRVQRYIPQKTSVLKRVANTSVYSKTNKAVRKLSISKRSAAGKDKMSSSTKAKQSQSKKPTPALTKDSQKTTQAKTTNMAKYLQESIPSITQSNTSRSTKNPQPSSISKPMTTSSPKGTRKQQPVSKAVKTPSIAASVKSLPAKLPSTETSAKQSPKTPPASPPKTPPLSPRRGSSALQRKRPSTPKPPTPPVPRSVALPSAKTSPRTRAKPNVELSPRVSPKSSPRSPVKSATAVATKLKRERRKKVLDNQNAIEETVRLVITEKQIEDASRDKNFERKEFVDGLFTFLRKTKQVKLFFRTRNRERHKTWEIRDGKRARLTFLQSFVAMETPGSPSIAQSREYVVSRILRKMCCDKQATQFASSSNTDPVQCCWKCEQKSVALKVAISWRNRQATSLLLHANVSVTAGHLVFAVKAEDEDMVLVAIKALKDRFAWNPGHPDVQWAMSIARHHGSNQIVRKLEKEGVASPGCKCKGSGFCCLV